MRPWLLFLIAGAAAATLGPWLTAPRSEPAGAPFVYVPPPGFFPAEGELKRTREGAGSRATWLASPTQVALLAGAGYVPQITLSHTASQASLRPTDLEKIVAGLPGVFAASGTTWAHERTEVRARPDGAKVALIEGRCTKGDVKYRSVQLVFPDDEGTSIATASYDDREAGQWQPLVEQSIDQATGVAKVARRSPTWVYVAWGAGGATLAFSAASIGKGRRRRKSPA